MIKRVLFSIFLLFTPLVLSAQPDSFKEMILHTASSIDGTVGVAVIHIESGEIITLNDSVHFPMQSVYKFPLALAVLHAVDEGKLSLNQKIRLTPDNLLPKTWSPLREKYPNGSVGVTVDEILQLTVSLSDNNGCDILFRLLGGTKKVDTYIKSMGIENISIAATEEEMHRVWKVQFTNWCSPSAMGQLFKMFFSDSILSKKSTEYLWDVLVRTSTGEHRIKGLLPADAVVGHKTGSSGTNADGITAASNDAGIMTLPNGNHVVLVVFITNSTADETSRDGVTSRIAKIVWDRYADGK
jgi:beta-lactamase class A